MKITLSKSQWERIGKIASWTKKTQIEQLQPDEMEKIFYEKTIMDNADDLKEAIEEERYEIAKICLKQITESLAHLTSES